MKNKIVEKINTNNLVIKFYDIKNLFIVNFKLINSLVIFIVN